MKNQGGVIMSELGFDTRRIAAGYDPADNRQSVSPPIYHTTAYDFRDTEHAENLFTYKEAGFLYTRVGNPTVTYFSERIRSLEGAKNAVAVGSGMAAITFTLLNLAAHGGTIIASPFLYGGTIDSFDRLFPDLGINIKLMGSKVRYPIFAWIVCQWGQTPLALFGLSHPATKTVSQPLIISIRLSR